MDPLDQKRRKLFKYLGAAIGGGAAAMMGYSVFNKEGAIDEWVTVGPVEALPEDRPQRSSLTLTEHGRFSERIVQKVVWLRRRPDGTAQVLSGACPHMNCTVAWKAELNGFDCACHISNFDSTGKVVSGPSPRPLDALEHRIDKGVLSVRYQRFKQSIPQKEVVT